MEITSADESWISQIMELEEKSISPSWTKGQMISELRNESSKFLIAVENTELNGYGIIRINGDEGEVFRVVTEPKKRGQGIGEKLLRGLIKMASHGVLKIYLEVRTSNEPAIRLYEKCGFETAGVRRNYYDDPAEDGVIMVMEVKRC